MFFDKFKFDKNQGDDLNRLFDEAAKQGAVLATLHFDAHGKDEASVSNALVSFVGNLSKEEGMLYCKGEVDAPIKGEDGVWSSNAEVRVLTKALHILVYVCFRYGPIGVEIEKPSKFELATGDVQGILLDVSKLANDYSKYIFEQVLSEEKKGELLKIMDARAEEGRKMREGAEKTK
ncbi:MAG: hypothetical protein WC607_03265 [Candidatus Micrarchaeia archaeon]